MKRGGEPRRQLTARAESPGDDELVMRAQRELPYVTDAFEALMRRYNRAVYRTCRRMLDDHDEAEDAAQEIMLKVFHALRGFEGRASFKTWLFRITCNVCHTRYHHKVREQQALVAYAGLVDVQVDDSPERLDAGRLLASVSTSERAVLTLRFVAELSVEEIADVLDLNLSAAKMRLYRAIEKLKRFGYAD
jgi:RNA polymerase sigma-70 factor, ECF subfamily